METVTGVSWVAGRSPRLMAMVQEFQVLRCCFCKTYQIQQVYGQGSGADCRRHVQKLNMLQGERMQAMEAAAWSIEEPTCSNIGYESQRLCTVSEQVESPTSSRWSVYLDQKTAEDASEEQGGEGEIVYMDRQQFQAGVRNASRDRSKRKRGLRSDSKQLDPYRHCTDSNEKESAQKKMGSYLKYVNSTPSESRGGNPEIRAMEWSNVLNCSQLESNPVAWLRNECQCDAATFPAKRQGAQASRWDRFLPHNNAEDDEFFDQDTGEAKGQPNWKRDCPSTDHSLQRSVLEDQGDYVGGSALFTSLELAGDGRPSSPLITGSAAEGIVTQPLAALELIGVATTVLGSPELATDAHEPSSCARRAVKDTSVHQLFPTSTRSTPEVSCTPKSEPPSSLLTLTACQSSAHGLSGTAPRLHVKQTNSFLSLFQTDEDFDDL
ncbi:MRN complex-interacting protein isoform X2 [Heterodontus francisci]|uniref:MRN complex-interacting protein isoform X2 n=1 Tax=Heterodontus francisci TaxID=7792 RepID=UPI00355AE4EF